MYLNMHKYVLKINIEKSVFYGRFTEDLLMDTSNGKDNPMKTFESQMQILQNHTTEVNLVLDCS